MQNSELGRADECSYQNWKLVYHLPTLQLWKGGIYEVGNSFCAFCALSVFFPTRTISTAKGDCRSVQVWNSGSRPLHLTSWLQTKILEKEQFRKRSSRFFPSFPRHGECGGLHFAFWILYRLCSGLVSLDVSLDVHDVISIKSTLLIELSAVLKMISILF
jgi:hypothetical protein